MTIHYNSDIGWHFTHGNQRHDGYNTREDAATALYDLERGRAPAPHKRAAAPLAVPPLQIERHTFCVADNEPYDHPWTTYTIGAAGLDINDDGGGNLLIFGMCVDFEDIRPLRDLMQLLAHPTIVKALEARPC